MLRGQQQFVLAGCFGGDAEGEAWVLTTMSEESIATLKSDADVERSGSPPRAADSLSNEGIYVLNWCKY